MIAPVNVLPGELWIHVGPTVPGFFPEHVHKVVGAEWEAKRTAVERRVAVVLELRMPLSALRSASRGNGTCRLTDLPKDAGNCADILTTGFFQGRGLVVGCLKNRNDLLFDPFVYDPTVQTFWEYLVSDEAPDPV